MRHEHEHDTALESPFRPAASGRQPTGSSTSYGIRVQGVEDGARRANAVARSRAIRGGLLSSARITSIVDDCPNVAALRKDPERFVAVRTGTCDHERVQCRTCRSRLDRHSLLETSR